MLGIIMNVCAKFHCSITHNRKVSVHKLKKDQKHQTGSAAAVQGLWRCAAERVRFPATAANFLMDAKSKNADVL